VRKRYFLLAAALLAAGPLFGAEVRLAVSDLAVHSDNAQYKYVGKGLSEMIAAELRKSRDITLIEREKRTALLEELEFSLSDLADSGRQAEVGRLLAAAYIVFGELIDMGPQVLLSLRLVDVQTEQIVWNQTLSDSLSRYDSIAAWFASSLLEHFGAEIDRTTAAKAAGKEEKNSEAVIALSSAIDLYDRREGEQARRELQTARKLDPQSEAVGWLWSKLVANTTRFKVLMEQYYSYLNPAFLGIMREDMLHAAANSDVFPIVTHIPIENVNYEDFGSGKAVSEQDFNVRLGYALPLGRGWGLRVEVLPVVGSLNRAWQGDYETPLDSVDVPRTAAGAVVDAGFRLSPRLALGIGVGIYSHSVSERGPAGPYSDPDRVLVAGNVGLLYRSPQETLLFDTRLGYNTEVYDLIDPDTLDLSGKASAPLYLENTLTLAMRNGSTFLIFKQIDSLSLDRTYLFATFMPAVEHFLAPWVSLRAGLEGSLAVLNDSTDFGLGVLGGITFRSLRRGFDVDLNLTWRQRPSRVVEGVLYSDLLALINLTWNGLWVRRE